MGGMISLFILLLTILFHISLLPNSVIAVNPSGFSMKIFHRDSKESPLYPGDHLTPEERFERLIQQSKNRARYIGRKISRLNNSINPDVARIPITDDGTGAYIASVGIGTFGRSQTYMDYFLEVDTGSDLTWIQCQGAIYFFPQQQFLYPATSSSTYKPLRCKEITRTGEMVDNPDCYPELCDDRGMCTYDKSYNDDSSTTGKLAIEKFTTNSDNHGLATFNIVMGCGLNQQNFASGIVYAGILGLSGGSKSLIKQLNLGKFEYCLRPYSDVGGGANTYLRFGSDTRLAGGLQQAYRTPLYNYGGQYYYLVLQDISVNGSRIGFQRRDFQYRASTERGGCIIDSGSSVSRMRASLFDRVAEKVTEYFGRFGLNPVTPSPFQYALCFLRLIKPFEYPTITYHFQDAEFLLHGHEEDTAFAVSQHYFCLGLIRESEPDNNIPYHVMFGAMQQARKRILHDVGEKLLYFAEEDCSNDYP